MPEGSRGGNDGGGLRSTSMGSRVKGNARGEFTRGGGGAGGRTSRHCAGVRPTMGAMVRHCVGMSLARWRSFSSSSRVHSVFLMDGSSHSYHRALHCLADLRTSSDEMRDHWFLPYFITAALRISSSVFFHTPPLIMMRMAPARRRDRHPQARRHEGRRENGEGVNLSRDDRGPRRFRVLRALTDGETGGPRRGFGGNPTRPAAREQTARAPSLGSKPLAGFTKFVWRPVSHSLPERLESQIHDYAAVDGGSVKNFPGGAHLTRKPPRGPAGAVTNVPGGTDATTLTRAPAPATHERYPH